MGALRSILLRCALPAALLAGCQESLFRDQQTPYTVPEETLRELAPADLAYAQYGPPVPLEEAIEAYHDLKVPKEMWIMENQYHPLWGIPNLGGMDCHDYVMDWLQGLFSGKRVPKKAGRIAYVGEQGDGPWSACDWEPTVKAGQAYF